MGHVIDHPMADRSETELRPAFGKRFDLTARSLDSTPCQHDPFLNTMGSGYSRVD
jgi:hypothetical protein